MVSLISSVRLRMSNSLMFVTGDAKVLENGVLTPFTSAFFSLKNRQPSTMFLSEIVTDKQGGGGGVSPRKSVVQSACQSDVTSRVSDFQNGEQSVLRIDG